MEDFSSNESKTVTPVFVLTNTRKKPKNDRLHAKKPKIMTTVISSLIFHPSPLHLRTPSLSFPIVFFNFMAMAPAKLYRKSSSANKIQRQQRSNSSFQFLTCLGRYGVVFCILLAALWLTILWRSHSTLLKKIAINDGETKSALGIPRLPFQKKNLDDLPKLPTPNDAATWRLPPGIDAIYERAKRDDQLCRSLEPDGFTGYDVSTRIHYQKDTIATLPAFGFLGDVEAWNTSKSIGDPIAEPSRWQCELPADTECHESQFTVVFMAYNPDRLGITLNMIRKMLEEEEWNDIVSEVVIVWNGEREVDESEHGRKVLAFAKGHKLRIVYPLKMGFPNDLMNRYHPDVVQVTSKAILYYDDDGPFYSSAAVRGGFELWKRHSSAQIGAMARQLDYGPRQQKERTELDPKPNDSLFVTHCTNVDDKVSYNFRYFANYDANMVLPSGSFLHVNYLCFLWHPVLAPIREFVLAHPVHPDDMTVSMIVSQLSGRAPRVYSRRLGSRDKSKQERRQLRRIADSNATLREDDEDDPDTGVVPSSEHRRSLMHGIDWDAGSGMNDAKQVWADLRTIAVNALVRYFGSLNSGSIGWCEGTEHYNPSIPGKCQPVMAKQGMLPWMNADNTHKDTCP